VAGQQEGDALILLIELRGADLVREVQVTQHPSIGGDDRHP